MMTFRGDGDFQADVRFEFGRVTWDTGTDLLLLVDIDTEPHFGPDRQLFLSFEGGLDVSSIVDFAAVAGSLVDEDGTQTDGPFAVGTDIDFGALAFVQVSQDDLLIGDEAANDFGAGAGDDTLVGGDGNDEMRGGAGYDVIDYFIESETRDPQQVQSITVNGVKQTVSDSYGATDTYSGVEAIYGSIFADVFTGPNKGSLVVTGSQFEDTFRGRKGELIVDYEPEKQWGGAQGVTVRLNKGQATDTFGDIDTLIQVDGVIGTNSKDDMKAGKDAAQFWGLKGADKLVGGLGRDMLDGGKGKDVLTGKGGADTFVFGLGYDRDKITDFRVTKDMLEIEGRMLKAGIRDGDDVVERYGEITNGKAVLDFGKGDVLVLNGVEDLTALADRIDIV